MSINLSVAADGISFPIRVISRSSKSKISGEHDGAMKVRIAAPPVNGAANAELIRLFAKQFGVARSEVEIVAGETSRNKRIKISSITRSEFEACLK